MKKLFVYLQRNKGDSYAKLKISHLPRQLDCEWIHANEPKLNMKYGMYTDEIYESWDGQGGKSVYHHDSDIELPKGTIEKIIGKKLSFNDGPVKI